MLQYVANEENNLNSWSVYVTCAETYNIHIKSIQLTAKVCCKENEYKETQTAFSFILFIINN